MSGPLPARSRFARLVLSLALVVLAVSPLSAADAEGEGEADPLSGLSYRSIGPAAGGRVTRVHGVAGDALSWFVATASGGVWRSRDGGVSWEPIFDDTGMPSAGSIAVAPSDPNVIYVGAGEANIRGNVVEGDGIYRSRDGGDSWEQVWEQRGQIGTVIVHPGDPDTVYAAVLGKPFGPNAERGVYRTRDGGDTWQRVLAKDADTGASDVAMHPANPRILLAGLWQARRYPWDMTSGGPGSGLHRSKDGGDSWEEVEDAGLPAKPWGKVGVRFAPSDPNRVYALIEAEEGGLFRSDDGGGTWELVNPSRGLRQRAWYYTTLTVDPSDADTVWFPQVGMLKTIDGGATVLRAEADGWDFHDVWIDPEDPRSLAAGSDAGIAISRDGGATWRRPPLPISQAYHVATDTHLPYRVMATLQDWGTTSGPSDSLHGGGIRLSDWQTVGGGEAGHIVADPADPDTVWAGEYLGVITRHDRRTGRSRNVSIYPWNGSGHPAGDLEHRFQWTAPIVVSPHDSGVVYHAANVLFRTEDGGQSWRAISPDLTRDDESKQGWAGGPITGDLTGVETYGTIFAVAESPLEAGLLWAGTDDGRVHRTGDGGATWTEVTANLPGLPEWATVAAIEPSPHRAGTAWLVADAHRLDDRRPYLWRTDDFGATWTSLAAGLPDDVHLRSVREDPEVPGLLYLGTDRGVRFSPDGGATWRSLQLDLPPVPVADLVVHVDEEGADLVLGTQGRSLWVLDDLTPVREAAAAAPTALRLFAPPPALRWHERDLAGSDAGAGANPPRGLLVTYWLPEAAVEDEEIVLEVIDASGRTVRTLTSTPEPWEIGPEHPDYPPGFELEAELSADAGYNRAAWDLTWEGAGFADGSLVDWGHPSNGAPALPGEYMLRLTVGGETAETTATVLPDPRSDVSSEALEAQLDFALALRDDLRRTIAAIATVRELRARLESRMALAEGEGDELAGMAAAIVERLDTLEARLHNPEAEVTYDILAGRGGGAQLYSQLSPLYSFAVEGEGAPTQGMREVAAEHHATLEALEAELAEIVEDDLAAFERRSCEELPYARPVRADLEVPPGLVVPWFYEYDPPSTLVVEEHPTPRAKYPFVDVHNHQRQMGDFTEAEWDELVAAMDAMNMAVMVNLSGRGFRRIERPDGTTGFGFGGTETVRAGIEAAEEHAPGRVVAFTNLDTSELGTPGWAEAAVAQLEADVAAGARGLKIYKSLGMGSVDAAGERIAVDDPRLDPVLAKCGELGIPVLIHSADPAAFWQERTPENERLLELMERAGRYQGDGENPAFEAILAEQHRLFRNHPETIFINAHLGWMGNDLARLGALLDELPNVYTEIGAVLAELGRQPRTAREFLIRYQDRVLFGKDSWNPEEYPVYFRVLETADEYFDYYRRRHAFWKMYGLDLPDEVLKKIYYANALQIVPGLDRSLFPPVP